MCPTSGIAFHKIKQRIPLEVGNKAKLYLFVGSAYIKYGNGSTGMGQKIIHHFLKIGLPARPVKRETNFFTFVVRVGLKTKKNTPGLSMTKFIT